MSMPAPRGTVEAEIADLEERLRQAELGPDPKFFEEVLDDSVVLVSEGGQPFLTKSKVVSAHQPGSAPKFTRVDMTDMKIIDHGTSAVVTCRGTYESPGSNFSLKFMRVWLKKNNRWKIVAGSIAKLPNPKTCPSSDDHAQRASLVCLVVAVAA